MDVQLNTSSVRNIQLDSAALREAEGQAAVLASTPILSSKNVSISSKFSDLDSIIAALRLETNEAKLNAARARLLSAIDQLADISYEDTGKLASIKATRDELSAAEAVLEKKSDELKSAKSDLNKAEAGLNKANVALTNAQEAEASAQASYDNAVAELDEYMKGENVDPSVVDKLKLEVGVLKQKLEIAKGDTAEANQNLNSAQDTYNTALSKHGVAQSKYDAALETVNALKTKIDALLESLDSASLAALRDTLTLLASDLAYLFDEIEDEGKRALLESIQSVEDVISESLDRLDGKMIYEVSDRHDEMV